MQQTELLFYDGHCALCHGAVKFVITHDHSGTKFRCAPLQGETFQRRVPARQRDELPDSIVVQTFDESLLVRSDAFLHILRRLGGRWSVLASLMGIIPRALRDIIYDFIARIRYNAFGRSNDLCPVIPRDLSQRFDP
jgi:predicted DCC family thiol-disulfide oxidoreductase YuxK